MDLFDTHFHLEPNDDLNALVDRAASNGVQWLMIAGASIENTGFLLERIGNFPHVFTAVGVHPQDALNFKLEHRSLFFEYLLNPKVKAVGEIGLDYYHDASDSSTQKSVFIEFLRLASDRRLPVIIHCREAFADCYEIVKQEFCRELNFVIHCFTGTASWAERFIDLGGYISFNGILTFKKSEDIREVLRAVPLERVLFETDSPYLAPVPFRGKRNEPAYLSHIVQCAAETVNVEYDELAEISTRNAYRFYNLQSSV